MTQLSKGFITTVTDRVDSRVLPKWAELKMQYQMDICNSRIALAIANTEYEE